MWQFNRIALPVFGAVIILVVVIVPTIRLRRRTGLWPINRQQMRGSLQRYVGGGLALSIIGYGAWMWCYALLDPRQLYVWSLPTAMNWLGWGMAVLGVVIISISQIQMGSSWRIGIEQQRTELVQQGLYKFIRNPIYTSWSLIVLGVVLITPSPWTVMGWVWVVTLLGMQARLEEQHLMAMHGEAYREYAGLVGRFVPGIGRLKR